MVFKVTTLQPDSMMLQRVSPTSMAFSHIHNDGLLYFSHLCKTSQQTTAADAVIRENLIGMVKHPPPIGLQLRKTPSLLELVELNLKGRAETNHNSAEKLKAVHFPISLLRIGAFMIIPTHEAHLVAKCYYAKRKVVWEILDNGLKNKIEVSWQDILGMRAIIEENRPGILEIELNQPPAFFHESDPKPRKHTIWKISSDFSGGQASIYRRHYLEFPPGVLDKHYEKLIQCDDRLFQLSRKAFPSLHSPYFLPDSYRGATDFSYGHNCRRSETNQQPLPLVSTQQVEQFRSAALGISDSTSPTSVIDICSPMNGVQHPKLTFWSQGLEDYANFFEMDSMSSASDVEPHTSMEFNDIVQILLTDTDSESVCKERQMAKVKSLSTFAALSEQVDPAHNTNPNTQMDWSFTDINSLETLSNSSQEQYPNVKHMHGELSDESRLFYTQAQPLHSIPPPQVFSANLEAYVPEILYPRVIPKWSTREHNNYHDYHG